MSKKRPKIVYNFHFFGSNVSVLVFYEFDAQHRLNVKPNSTQKFYIFPNNSKLASFFEKIFEINYAFFECMLCSSKT